MATVLVTDDDTDSLEALGAALRSAGHDVIEASSAREALELLARVDVDVLLTDVGMADMDGIELCLHVVGNRPDVPAIVITGQSRFDVGVAALRARVHDFLLKPVQTRTLLAAIERAAQHRSLQKQLSALESVTEPAHFEGFEGAVGQSAVMQQALDMALRVADTEASVLISGASGTGKELVARIVHQNSVRRAMPFVSINCAALPEALLESELFGHAKGAFTDARQGYEGLFRKAEGGTFFLDEIGEMPLGLQPKLLRALQERTVRPVGSATEVPIDVRIIAATNHDLERSVKQKRFRADLLFRINVVHIALPPLRVRGADIILLAHHFLARLAARAKTAIRTLSPAAAEQLLAYDWPGNVRELQNCMERAVALGRYDTIGPEDLPDRLRKARPTLSAVTAEDELLTLRALQDQHISRVLSRVAGNKTTAARVLGIDRTTLYRKLDGGDCGAASDGDPETQK